MRVFYFPEFSDVEMLNDHVNRASWYISCLNPSSINFYTEIDYHFEEKSYFSKKLKDLVNDGFSKEVFKLRNSQEIKNLKPVDGDIVIQWRDRDDFSDEQKTLLDNYRKVAKVYDVNKSRRMEGSLYIEVSRDYYQADARFLDENRKKFTAINNKYSNYSDAFIFCTGPSISEYKNYRYDDGLKIVCNSVINDSEFMEEVKPDILTFADPIFHFGCSSYAEAFRDRLLESARTYDFDIFIPVKYYPIFCHFMPELADRTIAIPYAEREGFNIDLLSDFSAKTTDNILTFMMLPLAASLAENIFIMGCDGRPLEQDNYFWTHNTKTQFTGEMESIKYAHPSFFNLEYNEYYLRHCDNVEAFFEIGEKKGKKFHSIGFSYIPALVKRNYKYKDYAENIENTLFVSINPDLEDSFGHFMHYDTRFYEQLGGGEVLVSLANVSMDRIGTDFLVDPVFSHNTWRVRWTLERPVYNAWKNELTAALREIAILKRPVSVYMYPGALRFYAVILEILSSNQHLNRLNFNINLFYTHMDYAGSAFSQDIKFSEYSLLIDMYKRFSFDFPNVKLYSDSEKLTSYLSSDFDIHLNSWPMIGVTNPKSIQQVLDKGAKVDRSSINVLFPGTGQLAKGYDLVCDLMLSYQTTPEIDGRPIVFFIRDQFRDTEENNAQLKAKYEKVKGLPWVSVMSGHLEENDYLEYFNSADVVLLPYRRSAFHTRTSGCLIDAFSFNKPVIAFEDTWLGDLVLELDAGVLAKDGDVVSLGVALESIISRGKIEISVAQRFCASHLKEILSINYDNDLNSSLRLVSEQIKISMPYALHFSEKKSKPIKKTASLKLKSEVVYPSEEEGWGKTTSHEISMWLLKYPLAHKLGRKIWHGGKKLRGRLMR